MSPHILGSWIYLPDVFVFPGTHRLLTGERPKISHLRENAGMPRLDERG